MVNIDGDLIREAYLKFRLIPAYTSPAPHSQVDKLNGIRHLLIVLVAA